MDALRNSTKTCMAQWQGEVLAGLNGKDTLINSLESCGDPKDTVGHSRDFGFAFE